MYGPTQSNVRLKYASQQARPRPASLEVKCLAALHRRSSCAPELCGKDITHPVAKITVLTTYIFPNRQHPQITDYPFCAFPLA